MTKMNGPEYVRGYNAAISCMRALQSKLTDLPLTDDPSGELDPLVARMDKGRAKYPDGCTALSLLDEAGEFAHAINKRESLGRVRDELLDVAAVAMRLYLGEVDTSRIIDGLVQRRVRTVVQETEASSSNEQEPNLDKITAEVKGAQNAEAVAWMTHQYVSAMKELNAAEHQLARIGEAWRKAFPDDPELTGPLVEEAVTILAAKVESLRNTPWVPKVGDRVMPRLPATPMYYGTITATRISVDVGWDGDPGTGEWRISDLKPVPEGARVRPDLDSFLDESVTDEELRQAVRGADPWDGMASPDVTIGDVDRAEAWASVYIGGHEKGDKVTTHLANLIAAARIGR